MIQAGRRLVSTCSSSSRGRSAPGQQLTQMVPFIARHRPQRAGLRIDQVDRIRNPRQRLVVVRHDDGRARMFGVRGFNHARDFRRRGTVQARRGLVVEHDVRVVRQCPGNGQAAAADRRSTHWSARRSALPVLPAGAQVRACRRLPPRCGQWARASRTFCSGDSSSNSAKSWNTTPTECRCLSGRPSRSHRHTAPDTWIPSSRSSSRPAMTFRSVDLPTPLRPTINVTWPAANRADVSCSRIREPACTVRPRMSTSTSCRRSVAAGTGTVGHGRTPCNWTANGFTCG